MSGTIIDDSNPAVVYSGRWSAIKASSAYQGTLHESTTLNDKATVTFSGTSILVNSGQQGIGWRTRSSYSIDGGSPTVYSNDTYQSSTAAYTSSTLTNGQHTLTVTNLDDRQVYLFLDSFLVFTTTDDSATTSSPTNPTTTFADSTTSTSPIGTTTSSSTSGATFSGAVTITPRSSSVGTRLPASPTPSQSTAAKPGDTNQIPLIVAPIVGTIVICVIIFLILSRRWKKKVPDSPISSAFYKPIPVRPPLHLPEGRKPSSLIHSWNDPPPYVEEPQSSSQLPTPIRQPAKFITR